MSIELGTAAVESLTDVAVALGGWQQDESTLQLHPGDLGWHWRFGAVTTAAAVRTWSREGALLAVGFLDGPDLLRLAIAPDAHDDPALARRMADDIVDPDRSVLLAGDAFVEARRADALRRVLLERGWTLDEAWTPLRRDLAEPVEDVALRVEVVSETSTGVAASLIDARAEVQRAAFDGSIFTADRWRDMAAGPLYEQARCLLAFDVEGTPVAAATVWSAGPGRPGILEPMGVHRDHRGRGYGTAITVAAAAALRELGASSAMVCTPSSNVGGVATYRAAGFEPLVEARDLRRP